MCLHGFNVKWNVQHCCLNMWLNPCLAQRQRQTLTAPFCRSHSSTPTDAAVPTECKLHLMVRRKQSGGPLKIRELSWPRECLYVFNRFCASQREQWLGFCGRAGERKNPGSGGGGEMGKHKVSMTETFELCSLQARSKTTGGLQRHFALSW